MEGISNHGPALGHFTFYYYYSNILLDVSMYLANGMTDRFYAFLKQEQSISK